MKSFDAVPAAYAIASICMFNHNKDRNRTPGMIIAYNAGQKGPVELHIRLLNFVDDICD